MNKPDAQAALFGRAASGKIAILIKRVSQDPNLPTPAYETAEASGFDLRASIAEPMIIPPHRSVLVPTGFAMAIPPGYELQIRPRSGLALKHNITVPNSPGTVDADYRGEIKVILHNLGAEPFAVNALMRIAQGVVAHVVRADWVATETLPPTKRGDQGFGSTGLM